MANAEPLRRQIWEVFVDWKFADPRYSEGFERAQTLR